MQIFYNNHTTDISLTASYDVDIVIEGLITAVIPITQDALNNELITVPAEVIV